MALFSYKAKDNKGKIIEDVIQAGSKKEAVSILQSDDLQILTLKLMKDKDRSIFGGGISVSDKAAFCRFLATMLRAGLPLPEAMEIIRQETESQKLREVLLDAAFSIRKGASLSSVLTRYKSDFDPVFLTMVKAGEESGTLDKSFEYLAKELLASYELSQKVKSSLMYPAVIVVAMLADAVVMLFFVLPKLSEVFSQFNAKLPATTKFLLDVSGTIGANTGLTLALFFTSIFVFVMLFVIRTTREKIMSVIFKLPVVGKVVNQVDIARFARTLSTLLRSGVPIMVALDVASDVLTQPGMKQQAKEFSAGVSKGESLSDIISKDKKMFPVTMTQTIRAGEKTGSLDQVLEEMAAFYEMEVDYSLKRAIALLEPALMLIIGVAVGAMVVIMIAPIYSIVGGIQGGA